MLTWANIGLALIRLLTVALSFIERERLLYEARMKAEREKKEADEKKIQDAKDLDDTYNGMSADDRERLRNDEGIYRD